MEKLIVVLIGIVMSYFIIAFAPISGGGMSSFATFAFGFYLFSTTWAMVYGIVFDSN